MLTIVAPHAARARCVPHPPTTTEDAQIVDARTPSRVARAMTCVMSGSSAAPQLVLDAQLPVLARAPRHIEIEEPVPDRHAQDEPQRRHDPGRRTHAPDPR